MVKRTALFIAAIVSLAIAGCGGGEGAAEGETIKIGHFASMTGAEATFGKQVDDGVKLAVEEINAAGGINGKKIELMTEDTRSTTQDAISAAEKLLARDKVTALIGEVASTRSIAGAPIADREKIPMLSPASTNEKVTVVDGKTRPYVFRICFIDPFQGTVMAKFARENLKVTKIAIITDNASDYSIGLAASFKQKFQELGGQIVAEQSFDGKQTDFKAQLTAVKAAGPEAIFIPGYYQAVSLMAQQARSLGITVPLLGGDGWDSPALTEGDAAKKALEGSYFSNHYSEQDTAPRVREFISKYQKKFNEVPGAMAALGYDAMHILAKIMKDSGKTDSESIRAGLSGLKDYPGVTGNITIDDKHNAAKSAVVLQIKDGKFTYSSTVSP